MAKTVKIKPSTPHAHGCSRCHDRFEDICDEPYSDQICLRCKGSPYPPPLWVVDRRPKDCCRVSSRETTKEERSIYRLGGTSSWWICRTCKRTFPYNPARRSQA